MKRLTLALLAFSISGILVPLALVEGKPAQPQQVASGPSSTTAIVTGFVVRSINATNAEFGYDVTFSNTTMTFQGVVDVNVSLPTTSQTMQVDVTNAIQAFAVSQFGLAAPNPSDIIYPPI